MERKKVYITGSTTLSDEDNDEDRVLKTASGFAAAAEAARV